MPSALRSGRKQPSLRRLLCRGRKKLKFGSDPLHQAASPGPQQSSGLVYAAATLLGLPAEPRNIIYEYVLSNDGKELIISACLKDPGLLRTNRQIRAEASIIFYTSPNLVLELRNLDYSLAIKWAARLHSLDIRQGRKVRCWECYDWEKVAAWCKIVWQDEHACCFTSANEVKGAWCGMVAAAHDVVRLCRVVEWTRCEDLLRDLRGEVEVYEPRWREKFESMVH